MPSPWPLATRFGRLSQIVGALLASTGAIVLLAWAFDLAVLAANRWSPSAPAAGAILVAGLSLFLAGRVLVRSETQHDAAVQALRDSEALYHSLVEGLPLNIF